MLHLAPRLLVPVMNWWCDVTLFVGGQCMRVALTGSFVPADPNDLDGEP